MPLSYILLMKENIYSFTDHSFTPVQILRALVHFGELAACVSCAVSIRTLRTRDFWTNY